jgi:hypothetical protein
MSVPNRVSCAKTRASPFQLETARHCGMIAASRSSLSAFWDLSVLCCSF